MVIRYFVVGSLILLARGSYGQNNEYTGDFPTQNATVPGGDGQKGTAVHTTQGAVQTPTASAGATPLASAVINRNPSPNAGAPVISHQSAPTSSNGQLQEAPQVPATVAEANKMVEELLHSGHKDEAVALAREARKEWPEDQNLMSVDKIVGYKNGSMFARAKDLAREIMEGMTLNAGAVPEQGGAYAAAGSKGEVMPTMAGVISLPGGGAERAINMGDARAVLSAMAIHDYQKMAQRASAAIAKNQKDFRSFRSRSFAQRKLGHLKEAEADARRAVAIEPKDLMSRTMLVDVLVAQKRPKEAVVEAQAGIDARHDLPADKAVAHLYYARSKAWALLGDKDLELKDTARAADIQPELYSAAALLRADGVPASSSWLPDNPWAQALVGGLAAAAVLLPLSWTLGWWRRDERA